MRNNLQSSSRECGELGCFSIRPVESVGTTPLPPERELPPLVSQPTPTFIPIGYLLARVSYFHTNNLFSSALDPKEDGLVYSGLTLSSAPVALGEKTFLTGAVEGNLIRYIDQSTFNSNQLVLRLGVYQQLTQEMFAEFGWINQQLFYARNSDKFGFSSGFRFFNEHSLRISLGRRDSLSPKLTLYSLYELRWNLANPESRNRLINSVWLSLNYDLQKALQVGLGYQFGYSNFTQRPRDDFQHRILWSFNLRNL
ncbi:MAG: hypothetical protein HC908_07715 [Calothrix sp. SM1_7_51]|nr:hypothetical protein [Calothrix sp. SM1_7_51]